MDYWLWIVCNMQYRCCQGCATSGRYFIYGCDRKKTDKTTHLCRWFTDSRESVLNSTIARERLRPQFSQFQFKRETRRMADCCKSVCVFSLLWFVLWFFQFHSVRPQTIAFCGDLEWLPRMNLVRIDKNSDRFSGEQKKDFGRYAENNDNRRIITVHSLN